MMGEKVRTSWQVVFKKLMLMCPAEIAGLISGGPLQAYRIMYSVLLPKVQVLCHPRESMA